MNELYEKIYKNIQRKVPDWTIENFYLAVLSQGKLKSIKRFSQGETGCSVNPYELSWHIKALKGDAYIIVHNHPSGRLDHSFGDMNAIDCLRGRVDFPLLGSMIVTRKTYALYEK